MIPKPGDTVAIHDPIQLFDEIHKIQGVIKQKDHLTKRNADWIVVLEGYGYANIFWDGEKWKAR